MKGLLSFFCVLVFSLGCLELYHRSESRGLSFSTEPVLEAESLLSQQLWAEAKLMAQFIQSESNGGDAERAVEIEAIADTELESYSNKIKSFVAGMASGEPKDLSSMMGSLSLDLFVIGDVRDLLVQGWKQAKYGEGDQLIMGLSAIGLASTLAPEVDWAPALMKGFRKTGALSKRFVASAKTVSIKALKNRQFANLGALVSDFGVAATRLGPGPLTRVMKSIDEPAELASLASAAKINSAGTYALVNLTGKTGVKRLRQTGGNVTQVLATVKTSSRFVKSIRKMTRAIPTAWLWISTLVAGLILFRFLFKWLQKFRFKQSSAVRHSH